MKEIITRGTGTRRSRSRASSLSLVALALVAPQERCRDRIGKDGTLGSREPGLMAGDPARGYAERRDGPAQLSLLRPTTEMA